MKLRMAAGLLALGMLLTGCEKQAENSAPDSKVNSAEITDTESNAASNSADDGESKTDEDIIVITLYPDQAPISCENFENLVKQGYYDGLTFHRIVEGFVAQGGDPASCTIEKELPAVKPIKGEFPQNGVENTISHQRGVVSMARTTDKNSATSQFFICYADCSASLDGNYAAFGIVTQGMEVVDGFLNVQRTIGSDGALSSPVTPIVMEKAEMIEDDADGHPQVKITMAD